MASLQFTEDEFRDVLFKAQAIYRITGSVRCPYFREPVLFNVQGFEHIRRKAWNRGRSRSDQYMRLKYIRLAPEILRLSHTVQGVWNGPYRVRHHRHGRWEEAFVPATFYEFVAVLKERRFKVIVKEVGNERVFWSLIPFWRQPEQGSRILHDGNLATD